MPAFLRRASTAGFDQVYYRPPCSVSIFGSRFGCFPFRFSTSTRDLRVGEPSHSTRRRGVCRWPPSEIWSRIILALRDRLYCMLEYQYNASSCNMGRSIRVGSLRGEFLVMFISSLGKPISKFCVVSRKYHVQGLSRARS